jgi:hypothetical protein
VSVLANAISSWIKIGKQVTIITVGIRISIASNTTRIRVKIIMKITICINMPIGSRMTTVNQIQMITRVKV